MRLRAASVAAIVLGFLLVSQSLAGLSAAALSGASGSPPTAASNVPTFAPDYIILGQLKGTTVTQSDRPQSASISGNFQYASTYYGPEDLQSAYGATSLFGSGYEGQGQTIAVIDAYGDPTIYQDLATFDRQFGLPSVGLTVVPVGPYEPSLGITYGWDAETALDVEAAHTMAPYAHINLIVAANASNALFEAVKLVVDRHLGDVVTMSWGLGDNSFGESGFSASGFLNFPYVEYYFHKGAAEGISFFSSSGDYGAFGGTTEVTGQYPADSPFVTGVGGTTLFLGSNGAGYSIFNSSSSYQGEEAWSVSPQYIGPQGVSSGGGYSSLFPQPYYQAGAVSSKARSFPDVSADANPYTGMVIVLEGGTYAIGGTSLSSPMWAGMTADLNQYVGKDLGLLNPYLYSIYANSTEYGRDFHQVSYGFNGEYQAGPGYNLVTGLGTPNLPDLAADIKAQAQGLTITANTTASSIQSAPAQYSFGAKLTISAVITSSSGTTATTVQTGSFTAKLEGPGGQIASVPLAYGAGGWSGTYTISHSDPSGEWLVTVSGSSGAESGSGMTEVDVGDSLAILAPVPYPFNTAVTPGEPFIIQVGASTASGTDINNATLTAHLIRSGVTVTSVPLLPLGGGLYSASVNLAATQPQGSYTLLVDGPVVGSVFSYLYVGQEVTGVMLTPNDEAIPSAAPGEQVAFLAKAQTASGLGLYTSNVTADIYSLSGAKMASVTLQPAPNKVQFGDFNFFRYQQANFTIPSNLTQGFYKVQFLSSYQASGKPGTQFGNFTTGFYVSGPTLSYTMKTPTTAFEGEDVTAVAHITDAAGAPVTSGVFLATFVPSGYAYEAYATDFYGYTSAPMVYSSALGGWVAQYQIPSVLTEPNAFVGNLLSSSSGPWTVFVSGESAGASNAVVSKAFVNVLPYTYYSIGLLDGTSVQGAPLVSANGTGYTLASIGAASLEVRGLNLTLTGASVANLTVVDSRVTLSDSVVGSLSVTNSTIVLAHGTKVASISPALPTIAVSGLSEPLAGNTDFTVTVAGEQLTGSSLTATVDGSPLSLAATASSSGLTAKGSLSISSLPDGLHTLVLTATQSDGLSSTLTTYFTVSTQASTIVALTDLFYAATFVAIIALAIAIVALRRKQAPLPAGPAP